MFIFLLMNTHALRLNLLLLSLSRIQSKQIKNITLEIARVNSFKAYMNLVWLLTFKKNL